MSKKKSKKTKKHLPVKKKKNSKKTVLIISCVALAAMLLTVGFIVMDRLTNLKYVDFVGKQMQSRAAYDSKGKEVDLKEIYNVRYDNYHGSLVFNEDATFSMWMTVGPEDDAAGTFTYSRGDSVIKGEFKNGSKIEFKVIRDKDDNFTRIEAPYQGYTIYFS
ncbi:MAG: hypothetical protein K6F88_08030 [Ruminococcus sp.]|nr:hypothetical protein [Ruminococcus sp.]